MNENVNQNSTFRQKSTTPCSCRRFVFHRHASRANEFIFFTLRLMVSIIFFFFLTSRVPNKDFSNEDFLHRKSLSIYTTTTSLIQLVSVYCNLDLFSHFSIPSCGSKLFPLIMNITYLWHPSPIIIFCTSSHLSWFLRHTQLNQWWGCC